MSSSFSADMVRRADGDLYEKRKGKIPPNFQQYDKNQVKIS